MDKLRIHIVEPVGGHGGMDFYDYGLAQGLAAQGAEVAYYTCSKTKIRQIDGVETHTIFGNVWSKKGISKGINYLRSYLRAFKDADKKKADVVHLHLFEVGRLNLLILSMTKRFRFRTVITLHDVDPLASKATPKIHERTYALCDKIIVHNAFSRNELLKKQVSPDKIAVIPHGNYIPFIEAVPDVPREDTLRLLFFGQIKDVKGLDILLDALHIALKTTPKLHLTIAGRPWRSGWSKYADQIKNLELEGVVESRIEYIPNEEVASLFAKSDLIVLPYRRIYQSGVLLMTMSYGKACLASDLEPFREVITADKNGLLFTAGSAESLAEQLIRCAEHPEMLTPIANAGRALMETKFNWESVGMETMKLYRSIPGIRKS